MTPEFKAQWIEALRSGRYKQRHGGWVDNWQNPTKFCCLSVAMVEFKGTVHSMTNRDFKILPLEISRDARAKLIEMNDSENKSFEEIADWIESQEEL